MAGIVAPSQQPQGPDFIDTASCRCALQTTQSYDPYNALNNNEAWRCLGNSKEDIYSGSSGKWFLPVAQGLATDLNEPEDWAGNPPDPGNPFVVDGSGTSFVPYDSNASNLSLVDNSCNAQNDTIQTKQYYSAVNAAASGNSSTAGGLCLLANAVPITIQNETSWNQFGCNLGFFCQHNSVIRLPQFCPPVKDCQHARLAGGICPPMGPLEPAVCQPGSYCPRGGLQQIRCPAGYFCSIGAYEPTPCSAAASCAEGTVKNQSFLPFVFLLLLDLLFIAWVFGFKIVAHTKKKHHGRSQNSGFSLRKAVTLVDMNRRNAQYHSLEDNNDIALESRITMVRRQPTGFEEVIDDAFVYDDNFLNDDKPSSDLQLFVQSLSKCIGVTQFGLSFGFDDLKFQPRKASKPILSEVTGYIDHGSLWGVMGASGAGKSTFVNVLMGKQAHTGGVTKVNGVPGNISKYKKIIGYVPQDDVVLPELTVRENILHSARIRLPSNWSDSEIQKHVDILISCLQLSHVKDSLVGSPANPIISGGQRKRVSIGIELAAAPMALFLDEPTSGLDATSASSIMMTLKALSRLGITVVTIIHQPRQEIFESLDSLLLFGAGRMIYQGKEKNVQAYFEGLGFQFPSHGNPADVIGDIIAGEGHLYKRAGDTKVQSLIEYWKNTQQKAGYTPQHEVVSIQETRALRHSIKLRGAPIYRQIYFCLLRSMKQQYRLKSSFVFELAVGALAGSLIGLAELNQDGINFRGLYLPPYETLSSSLDYSSVPQMALLVGLSIGLTASSPGVKIFGEEKQVYYREAAAGHNRFAYYIGKVVSTIPRIVIATLHFSVMFYMLSTPRISWISAFVANLLYYYCIYGLASCVSMLTRREDGPLLATMVSLIVGVLNGMSPSLVTVTKWHMLWFWRACPGTWLAEAYFTENITPYNYLYQINDAANGIGYKLGQFGLDMLLLFCLGTIYRIVAFLGLYFLNRRRQR